MNKVRLPTMDVVVNCSQNITILLNKFFAQDEKQIYHATQQKQIIGVYKFDKIQILHSKNNAIKEISKHAS